MNLHRRALHTFLIGAILLAAAPPVTPAQGPQPSATLTGLITDPSGAVIPNASVTLHPSQPATPGDIPTLSGPNGRYTLLAPPGLKFVLIVSAPGFVTSQSQPLQLSPEKPRTFDVSLRIEAQAEQVNVSDDNDIDPTRNGDSLTLKGKDIDDLPLDSAELLQQLQALSGSPSPELTVDGFSGVSLPPRDTIREIRINQNPYSAQNDISPANGYIQIFTKPGTGHLHGDLFGYGNASPFNTRNRFNPSQPSYYSIGTFGGISGPINHHLSFAANFDTQQQQTNSLINATTLDANSNPISVIQAVPSPTASLDFSPRLDAAIGKKSTVILRYSLNHSTQTNGGIGLFSLPSQAYTNTSTNQTLQLSNSQIVTAKIVNDTRFQYQRSRVGQIPVSSDPTISVAGSFTGGGSNAGRYNDNQDRYELQNYVSATAGKQFFTFGGRFRATRDANRSTANYNGTFTYANLGLPANCTPLNSCHSYQLTQQALAANPHPTYAQADALIAAGGGPSQFTITTGNPSVAVTVADTALFLQDDWKARPTLTLAAGLRFETQTRIADHADFAPRFGFSWSLKPQKNKPALYVLRGGSGLFYNRFSSGYVLQAERQNGITQQEYIVSSPHFFDSASATGLTATNSATYQISPTLRAPYVLNSTLSLERQVKSFGSITFTFLNTRGVHTLLTRNLNAPLPGTYNPAVPTSGVRPLGTNQSVYEYDSEGLSRGNRLSTNFFLRFFKGKAGFYGYYMLRFETADASGGFPSNQYDLRADQGRSSSDSRHTGVVSSFLTLPFGFRSNIFAHAYSGSPYNITVGQDLNGDGIFNDRPAFATDLTRPSVVVTPLGAFDTSPLPGQTIIPINYGHGPGFFSVNMSLIKNFNFGPQLKPPPGAPAPKPAPGQKPHIDRRFSLSLQIDAQNLFNQVNLATPVGTLNSPLFGRSIALASSFGPTAANRLIQFQTYFHF